MIQTSQQTMSTILFIPLLATGFIIATILILMGLREKTNIARRLTLLRIGTVLLGLMVIVTPITWYGYWTYPSGSVLLTLTDIIILASLCSLGGIIVGVGLKLESRQVD